MNGNIIQAAWGILIPFAGTSLGAGCAFLMKNRMSQRLERGLNGFAAGAMLYVVVEELIPEMAQGEHSNLGAITFAAGFTVMMALDCALG